MGKGCKGGFGGSSAFGHTVHHTVHHTPVHAVHHSSAASTAVSSSYYGASNSFRPATTYYNEGAAPSAVARTAATTTTAQAAEPYVPYEPEYITTYETRESQVDEVMEKDWCDCFRFWFILSIVVFLILMLSLTFATAPKSLHNETLVMKF